MNAPRLKVREVQLYERSTTYRMPFRYGMVTLTAAPQAFVRVRLEVEGKGERWGASAEMMAAKWFDKSPELTNEQNFDQLRASLYLAADAYGRAGAETAFGLFDACHEGQIRSGARLGLNPLVAAYGPALLDRAVLDALCRAVGVSFRDGMRANIAGIRGTSHATDLEGFDFGAFLARLEPAPFVDVRHTVGMVDPMTAAEIPAPERLDDGLPQALEEVIAAYGCRFFKIKVRGDAQADLDRIAVIAAVLDRRPEPYRVTLDGNEQFETVEGVQELWDALASRPALSRFTDAVLFVEQPIKRATALDVDVAPLARRRPVIIDESDCNLDAFPAARARGYAGVSSKTCKGLYKSILNTARCRLWNAEEPGKGFFMSGEDLTCQAGISVQQDLALVSLLGIAHVERNGHHYVRGMTAAPEAEQQAFLAAHGDLYEKRAGVVCLKIRDGRVAIGSLGGAGYAHAADPDWDRLSVMVRP